MRTVYNFLVRKLEGKRPLGETRRKWAVSIRMDLTETGWKLWTGFIWLRIGTSGGPL
jgi:hypothetical protein